MKRDTPSAMWDAADYKYAIIDPLGRRVKNTVKGLLMTALGLLIVVAASIVLIALWEFFANRI